MIGPGNGSRYDLVFGAVNAGRRIAKEQHVRTNVRMPPFARFVRRMVIARAFSPAMGTDVAETLVGPNIHVCDRLMRNRVLFEREVLNNGVLDAKDFSE